MQRTMFPLCRAPAATRQRLAAALLLIAPLAASATADGPDYYRVRGVSAGSALNLRAEPSLDAPRIGRIPADARCVRNLGCSGGLTFDEFTTLSPAERERRAQENPRWCKVEYEGRVGWAAGRYLAEGDCPASARPR